MTPMITVQDEDYDRSNLNNSRPFSGMVKYKDMSVSA